MQYNLISFQYTIFLTNSICTTLLFVFLKKKSQVQMEHNLTSPHPLICPLGKILRQKFGKMGKNIVENAGNQPKISQKCFTKCSEMFAEHQDRTPNISNMCSASQNRTPNTSNTPKKTEHRTSNTVRPNTRNMYFLKKYRIYYLGEHEHVHVQCTNSSIQY